MQKAALGVSVEKDIRALNRTALDPRNSVVIEACAGSGKTWLLVSRVVRLLLAGVKPSEILAITFTRKAAQEMESRLHEWLHLLATQSDETAAKFLREREVPDAEIAALLPQARALFERFLTDQPGITVTTFHAWFLRLLKRAPLASGAASGASLVDHTSALLEEAWQLFAEDLQRRSTNTLARALSCLFDWYGLENTRSLLTGFVAKRAEWWAYTQGQPEPVTEALDRLRTSMPVTVDADVLGELFGDGARADQLDNYAELLQLNGAGVKKDSHFADQVRAALAEDDLERRFELICPVLLTEKGVPRSRKENKALETRLGPDNQHRFLELHEELAREFMEARAWLTEQMIYRMNEAGYACGNELLQRYQGLKRERGVVDYTDVEWRAYLLLNQSHYAEYMQHKLDARYRHILLDEFQDTNPLQWQVLKAWLEASGDAGSPPTVFLVGDPKQSIYRFRRAEPRLFGIAADYLVAKHGAQQLDQNVTRRSAPPVVAAVNELFRGQEHFLAHQSYQQKLPGCVEVLPLINRDDAPAAEPVRWRNPLQTPRANETDSRRELEAQQLAIKIGEVVGRWQIRDGENVRAARFEDVMVLVTRRTHLEVYERALRHAQIPYVSSRQGGLLDTLEADDLTALLQFLVVPFADLHLASALRSPVFSVSDDDLMALASTEGRTWWQRLERLVAQSQASGALVRAHRLLAGWIAVIDRLPVHDLLDRIYFEGDIVRRYEQAVPAAMRTAVAANMRAFMEVALSTESGRYPSLQGFLHELSSLRRAAPEEAPDVGVIAEAADAVRILTVHGAKGLEAPIVWLLDANAAERKAEGYGVLVDWPPEANAPLHFSLYSRQDEHGVSRTLLFEREERLSARENLNLLYVAMTRAKQALLVSGSEGRGSDDSWYRKIADAVRKAGVPRAGLPVAHGPPVSREVASPAKTRDALGESLCRPLGVGNRNDTLIDPRRRYGVLLHALLERVTSPNNVVDRQHLTRLLGISEDELSKLWSDAQAIITAPAMRRFFDPAQYLRAENELAYAAELGEMRRIDRFVEFNDSVWVLDYKTGDAVNRANLEMSARPYRAQLAEYRAAVSSLIPGKPVKSALVFGGGLLFPVSG